MHGTSDGSAQSALDIMSQWQWEHYDPDGFPRSLGLDLGEVVSRLAMAGQPKPHDTVLKMLCSADLTAFGQYRWKKYQWGKHFQHEVYNENIPPQQWQTLRNSIDEEQRQLAGNGWPMFSVDLEKLEMADCPTYEWQFSDNRFSTSCCPPDTPVTDKTYYEEWFSAWQIEIREPMVAAANPEPDIAPTHIAGDVRTVGRPLAAWWPDFVAELVAYTVEVGLPDGVGHQGQSEVIKDVCLRLQERGKEEPSRSQIQEAVNAVLRRMRSAGN